MLTIPDMSVHEAIIVSTEATTVDLKVKVTEQDTASTLSHYPFNI